LFKSLKMKLERELNGSNYSNKSDGFLIKKKTYDYQYAPLYAERLISMRTEVEKAALKKWEDRYTVKKSLVDLEKHKKSIIIGTLFKEMKNKPNILKELADDENNMIPIQPVGHRDKYIDIDDQLILEDEVQRILLIDPADATKTIIKDAKFCTGLVIALLGYEDDESKFVVWDYCFKETPFPRALSNPINDDNYLVFLSGIELDTESNESLLKLQLLIDFLNGDFLNSDFDNEEKTKKTDYESKMEEMLTKTSRMIIAGNSLSSSTQSKDMHKQAKYLTKNFVAGSVVAIKQLDDFLVQLTNKLDVDIMPGEFDPSNLMLPQQPLHHAMFTKTISRYTSKHFHSCTNPYQFKIDQISLLGTSGQFIDDIRRSTNLEDSIELMKLTLASGHLGPTCPDTLACYPYYGNDPFILKELPHVYFCGNQDKFQQDVYRDLHGNEVHLLSLPRFSSTASCVFFNLRTSECEEIFF